MTTLNYNIPSSIEEMFEQGENNYSIIDYSIQPMDNIHSMQYLLDIIGVTKDEIEINDGTQVILNNKKFDYKLIINSGGLGDFYSHSYEVIPLFDTIKNAGT